MNFDFPDEIKSMQQQAADYLTKTNSIGLARAVLDGDSELARRDWREMAELGWTGLTISEAYGGNGIGHIALCALAYELGRNLTPSPFASSIYIFAEALNRFGTEDQKQKYLPGLADGSRAACFARSEGLNDGRGDLVRCTFENGRLNGEKKPVADGMVADFALVVANEYGAEGLYLVDLGSDGVARSAVPTVEGIREHAQITFNSVAAEKLAAGSNDLAKLYDAAAILFAFEQVGGAQACLDMAVDYAKQRYAFGRPIGSFQAIKHKLADMFVAVELARSNAYYGAWALSCDAPELPVAASSARLSASKAYWLASKENIQTHGGMGFTWELDCHLYYRRAKALSLVVGNNRHWENRLVDGLKAGLVEL